ncbi:YbaN family protein [Pseudoxanthomonas sp. UTMC 1351]|uniref:YbaN family protein n=1 Tax=Pseudoxanthomonas sp. UTMC 1351 TaxID=2695853 RepID=UPI0034CF4B57
MKNRPGSPPSPETRESAPSRYRWAWLVLAYCSLAAGIVGIFLPVMPTTVFILIAAFAASRGSERLHRYLLAHKRFGPMIRDWQANGAVSRRAKWAATLTMLLSAVVLLTIMLSVGSHRWWMAAIPIACMAIVAAWLWRRPESPRQNGEQVTGNRE